MIRLEMKNYNMILTRKLQKYQHYHHVKWINMNILQIEQAKFTYSPLEKAFERQIKAIEQKLRIKKELLMEMHMLFMKIKH